MALGAWNPVSACACNAVSGRVDLSEARSGRQPDRVFSSSVRQPIFKVACQLTHIRGVAESLLFVFCGFDFDAEALAYFVLHLEHSRELLFREHANLEVEVRAFFCLTCHAILTDENKDGEHNTFRGDDQSQNSKGKWIEGFHAGNQAEIDHAPSEAQEEPVTVRTRYYRSF